MKKIRKSITVYKIKLITILSVFIFHSCIFSQKEEISINKTPYSKVELRILQDLNKITKTEKPRNYKNIATLNKVANYIKKELSKVCDTVSFQSYKVKNNTYKNVIASIGTQHEERIVIGAHYDVFGNSDGADDNASGVAGLLELARLLSENKELKYRIDFVAFTLEEPPFFRTESMGSFIHAKSLFDKNAPVKGMICLEMIGYYSTKENSQDYPIKEMKYIYGTKGDFVTIVQEEKVKHFSNQITESMKSQKRIKAVSFKGSSSVQGVDFSDHLNYWKFNYDAIMVTNTAFFRNKNYHTSKDKLETLDIRKMNLVIEQLYESIMKLD